MLPENYIRQIAATHLKCQPEDLIIEALYASHSKSIPIVEGVIYYIMEWHHLGNLIEIVSLNRDSEEYLGRYNLNFGLFTLGTKSNQKCSINYLKIYHK